MTDEEKNAQLRLDELSSEYNRLSERIREVEHERSEIEKAFPQLVD